MVLWKQPNCCCCWSSSWNKLSWRPTVKTLGLHFGRTNSYSWLGTKSASQKKIKKILYMDPTLEKKIKHTLQSTLSMAKWLHASSHIPSHPLQWRKDLLGVISGIAPATRTHTRCPRNGWKSSMALHLVYSDRLAHWILFLFFFLLCFRCFFFSSSPASRFMNYSQ